MAGTIQDLMSEGLIYIADTTGQIIDPQDFVNGFLTPENYGFIISDPNNAGRMEVLSQLTTLSSSSTYLAAL